MTITWLNAATGQSGAAGHAVGCGLLGRSHSWGATVPLILGTNAITVTASDSEGNVGRDMITVTRVLDTTSPTVSSTNPPNGAVGVPVEQAITATFSEAVDPTTVTAASFILRDSINNPINGSVTYSGTTATFTPSSNLTRSTSYTATIAADVRDPTGNQLPAPYIWAFTTGADTWQPISAVFAPIGRAGHTSVWSGTEIIVWGGTNGTGLNSGGRFNPGTNTWRSITLSNAPIGRSAHAAVWTGAEMIVWGGTTDGSGLLDTGGRYNPTADTWEPLSALNRPSERKNHTGVWTGTEMVIWGGRDGNGALNTGAKYNPATDSWQPISVVNAPEPRFDHTAVWTGSVMIVWGGTPNGLGNVWRSGGRYDPGTDTWTTITPNPEFGAWLHTAVWSGIEMIVWGGHQIVNTALNKFNLGARYNPTTNNWSLIVFEDAPSARTGHTAIWTENEMVVWGGEDVLSLTNRGGRYNPAINDWNSLSLNGAPSAREGHTAVWTGTDMIIWGGNDGTYVNTGGRYTP